MTTAATVVLGYEYMSCLDLHIKVLRWLMDPTAYIKAAHSQNTHTMGFSAASHLCVRIEALEAPSSAALPAQSCIK